MNPQMMFADRAISAKIILAALLANGLARIGSASQLQGTVRTVTLPDGSLGKVNQYYNVLIETRIIDRDSSSRW